MSEVIYLKVVRDLVLDGIPVSRRGMLTREKSGMLLRLDPWVHAVTVPERKLNYSFMFAEALWILRGSSRLEELSPYCGQIEQFSDDGVVMSGAYGPKFIAQRRYVIDTLTHDLCSRRAVISLWRDSPRDSLDIPCTLSLQFLTTVSANKLTLDLIVTMRSSDVYLGLPYDIFTFSMILCHVYLTMRSKFPNLVLGTVTVFAGSQHVYERDIEKCHQFMDSKRTRKYRPMIDNEINTPVDLEERLRDLRDCPKNFWINE